MTIRVEVGNNWAEVTDLRKISFGEARALRVKAATGNEEDAVRIAASCVESWEAYDSKTGERLGDPSLETLDRTTPAFGAAVVNAVAEGLQASLPLASKSEPSTTS